ncbi:MAG: pyrroline-5-carboxylate reductase [Firmicutes bacterium]|nr:pyrroline-5-carboxylate reductase [Bacillota bacterium]
MEVGVGFIGAGKMGSAIAKGIAKAGIIPPEKIYVFDIDIDKVDQLEKETGVTALKSNEEVIVKSDIIILAVVPSVIRTVLEPCKHLFNSKILVSIAAGVPISTYKEILGKNAKVVRTMPNRPALVSEGMTLISYHQDIISKEEIEIVKILFQTVGRVEILEENLMDEVVALTSSSPAYVFMLIESMADAAVLHGIPRRSAYTMAAQAVLGSAKMVLETGKHPAELKDEICTPAGTTIEAVKILEKNSFRHAIMEAMEKCTEKAKKIGEKYK